MFFGIWFDSSVVSLSISKFMSEEYLRRYNKTFIPVRNPIDIDQWLPFIKNDWEISGTVRIIYTGRLAVPNINSLYVFCETVDSLNKSGSGIMLDIYSIDDNRRFRKRIRKFSGINLHKAVPYTAIPKLIPVYDIVLLPIDFDKRRNQICKVLKSRLKLQNI